MEILNYRDVIGKPSVIGEFDVYIPALQITLFNLKVICTKKGHKFVAAPCYGKDYAGTKKFYPYWSFSEEKKKLFDEEIMRLLKPILDRNPF